MASAVLCPQSKETAESSASQLMTRIVQHQIKVAKTMSQLSFERTKADQRRSARRNPSRWHQAFRRRRCDLDYLTGDRDLADQGCHSPVNRKQHQKKNRNHGASRSRRAFVAAV